MRHSRSSNVIAIQSERWVQGPSAAWRQRREQLVYAYQLFAAFTEVRLHEFELIDEIHRLPPLPALRDVSVQPKE